MKFLRKLPQYFLYHTKLITKYICLLILLLFVEIFVVNSYIRTNTTDYLTQEFHETSRQFLEAYIDNINFRFSKYNSLLTAFADSEVLRSRFSHPELAETDYTAVNREISQILRNQFPYGFYDLTFYPAGEYDASCSKFMKEPDEMPEICKEYLEQEYYNRYFLHPAGTFQLERLSVLYPIYSKDNSRVVCIIHLTLFPQKVFKTIRNTEGESPENLFLINSEGDWIYGSSFSDTGDYLEYISHHTGKWYSGYPIDDFSGDSGIYITSLYSANGLRAVCYISLQASSAKLNALNRTLTISILLLATITLALGLALSFHLDHRFSRVLAKIACVSNGNLNISDAPPATDEIGTFDQNFTDMVKQLQRMIETNYISEMQKKDAQLMALQAQIQPHFLFNSLEIINSLIEIGQYDTACEANSRLSQLLRYSINYNSSETVTVQNEIEYMKDYLYIQNLRFHDKYQYHEQIDENCLGLPMLKLILQPLIENSIQHGFKERSSGNIYFSIAKEENILIIEISDDGNGMNDGEYHRLMEKLNTGFETNFQKQNQNIGVINIHRRLKLKYGSGYKMEIHTAPDRGMKTTLTLPFLYEDDTFDSGIQFLKQQEKDYEDTDC
ncbi:MAG: sensor histidine kinase [Lachnospiraceae bacterium]|nr:sensor histidine kinase [Lachnospiraceae bacterium]